MSVYLLQPSRGTSAIEYGHWEVVVTGDITALAGHHRVCTPPEVCRYISICVSTLCYMYHDEVCRVCRSDVLG